MKTLFRFAAAAVVLSFCQWAFAVTIIVTNTADSGPGSLRQALLDIASDVITFNISGVNSAKSSRADSDVPLATISLTSGELVINKNVTISGPGANVLAVSRAQTASAFGIFHVMPGRNVTIEGLTISNGVGSSGGGIYNDHSTLTVTDCAVTGNHAIEGGGIASSGDFSGNATLSINNSTLSANTAVSGGGAVFNSALLGNATALIANSTFSGNSAASAGGIFNYFDGAVLKIANSTVTGSVDFESASGGIYNYAGVVHIGNTIVNAGTSGVTIGNQEHGTVVSYGYNMSSDAGVMNEPGSTGSLDGPGDQTNTDPMLGPLKSNGGATWTHAPLINSPAIDRGKRDTIPALATDLDQRGFVRPVNDPAVPDATAGDTSDIGAVELAVGVHPDSAASRKTHGAVGDFDINLPFSGPVGVECRGDVMSNNYQLLINFSGNVTFSDAAVTHGTGSVSSTAGSGGPQAIINLTGVTSAQTITVALFDSDDGTHIGDVGIRMGVLVGDVGGNAVVNASDISSAKARVGQAVSASNFRADVNANGAINASDVGLVKSKAGTGLPP